MKTRNLLEIEHPAVPWLLTPALLALVLLLGVLSVHLPVAAAVLAVLVGALLLVAFFRMGRRS